MFYTNICQNLSYQYLQMNHTEFMDNSLSAFTLTFAMQLSYT